MALGVRPQTFGERLRDLFQSEPGIPIDGEMLDVQTQGELASAFRQLGVAIKDNPDAFLNLLERRGDGLERIASVFGRSNPEALAAAATLAAAGASNEFADQALTQARSPKDRLVGGTATSLVDVAEAI